MLFWLRKYCVNCVLGTFTPPLHTGKHPTQLSSCSTRRGFCLLRLGGAVCSLQHCCWFVCRYCYDHTTRTYYSSLLAISCPWTGRQEIEWNNEIGALDHLFKHHPFFIIRLNILELSSSRSVACTLLPVIAVSTFTSHTFYRWPLLIVI